MSAEFVEEYLYEYDRFADHLPLYIMVSGLTIWLSLLTFITFLEFGVPASEFETLMPLAAFLAFFVAAYPLLSPLVTMAVRRIREVDR